MITTKYHDKLHGSNFKKIHLSIEKNLLLCFNVKWDLSLHNVVIDYSCFFRLICLKMMNPLKIKVTKANILKYFKQFVSTNTKTREQNEIKVALIKAVSELLPQ